MKIATLLGAPWHPNYLGGVYRCECTHYTLLEREHHKHVVDKHSADIEFCRRNMAGAAFNRAFAKRKPEQAGKAHTAPEPPSAPLLPTAK